MKAMQYEREPIQLKVHKKAMANLEKQITNITKLSTWRILVHLYRRHEIVILQFAVLIMLAYGVWARLGR